MGIRCIDGEVQTEARNVSVGLRVAQVAPCFVGPVHRRGLAVAALSDAQRAELFPAPRRFRPCKTGRRRGPRVNYWQPIASSRLGLALLRIGRRIVGPRIIAILDNHPVGLDRLDKIARFHDEQEQLDALIRVLTPTQKAA